MTAPAPGIRAPLRLIETPPTSDDLRDYLRGEAAPISEDRDMYHFDATPDYRPSRLWEPVNAPVIRAERAKSRRHIWFAAGVILTFAALTVAEPAWNAWIEARVERDAAQVERIEK